ncbi:MULTISPECIES: HU family DNA-binding protein [unclassified Vibrio]|uniref:HU family DNA-binding protein n=1 Tax=unclassified Vibrio TaxID=2614977 RepID=UPI0012AA53F1|nr:MULTISPECIES: HU family DNA-binding protein [unclassified Vibrio]QFT40047.1 DNA-binding protein HU 1 [Vibrio sp. THAF64]QGM37992.1 DNA-binding protein HU 1 [Vibrio sp. THAF191d]QGN73428.1 DNA-binding protein HU 1 [Vibrio sp. THAF191c]
MRINRPELEELIAKRVGELLTDEHPDTIRLTTDSLFSILLDELAKGNELTINNFGRFRRSTRSRISRNPQTGEELGSNIEHYIVFSPFKEMVKIHEH